MDVRARATPKPRHKPKRRPKRRPKAKPKPTPKPTPTPTAKPEPLAESPATSGPEPVTRQAPPTTVERLYLNRLGTGVTPADVAALRRAGGPSAWLRSQLTPEAIQESGTAALVDSWFPDLHKTPAAVYADAARGKSRYQYTQDLANRTILRRVYSRRQVLETMVDFWSTTLHVPSMHDKAYLYRASYDDTIRSNALGRFDDLLVACSLHPAMRVYLDNWLSVRGAPNENQGRELLELHTVTRTAGYSEAMVKQSAVLLSGYTVDWGKSFEPVYDAQRHTTGSVSVLGFTASNTSADGRATTESYLRYLARHPATARSVATRLATAFVSDSPPDGLVDRLAAVFSASGTNIATTLKALADSPEFAASSGQKVRTPVADLVATMRVLGVGVRPPTGTGSAAYGLNGLHGDTTYLTWPRPDGPPLTGPAWASASRVFASYWMHGQLGGGFTKDLVYRAPASWLPAKQVTFDVLVDSLSQDLLGRSADTRVTNACRQALGVAGSAVVTDSHPALTWGFTRLVSALLDSPDHMTS